MDFFLSYGSTYTYLSVMRIERLAEQKGVSVNWRPFHLRTITTEQNNRPFVGKPVKMKYMWRDLERRASDHKLAFNGIPPYPVDPESLAHRVGVVAASEGWCPEYSRELYRRWFLEHKAPGDAQDLRRLIAKLGRDPEAVLSRADTDDTMARLMAETDVARALGIFGSPTFADSAEIFWGDDRLETALEWAKGTHSMLSRRGPDLAPVVRTP